MTDPTTTVLITEVVKGVIGRLFARVEKLRPQHTHEKLEPRLERHLKMVANWTDRIEFYGLSAANTTEESTIPLRYASKERRFRPARAQVADLEEVSLLNNSSHLVVVGAPGSGKTTTIKRLARKVLLEPPQTEKDQVACPLIVRLREHDLASETLAEVIADLLGIAYRRKQRKIFDRERHLQLVNERDDRMRELRERISAQRHLKKTTSALYRDRRDLQELSEVPDSDLVDRATTIEEVSYIGDELLNNLLPEILDGLGALLFVDGLDELPGTARLRVEQDLSKLASHLQTARIVASCREGDYRHIEFFDTVQLCPLDENQARDIAERWLTDADPFFFALSRVPYSDLSNRPLFLTYLLVIFQNLSELPIVPSDVYMRIIWLLLRDWDEERTVVRKSRYANFYPERKLDFLSGLAYNLVLVQGKRSFSSDDLAIAYRKISSEFGLPNSEVQQVVAELESHTGLIVEAGFETFEFSHASLQEYLAARYLVKMPIIEDDPGVHFPNYPAVFAVAAALAPRSGDWLARTIMLSGPEKSRARELSSLLSRFVQERPSLPEDTYLGYALLACLFHDNEDIVDQVFEVLALSGAAASLQRALSSYVVRRVEDAVLLSYGPAYGSDEAARVARLRRAGLRLAQEGRVELSTFQRVVEHLDLDFDLKSFSARLRPKRD